jgi:hypothetical protein
MHSSFKHSPAHVLDLYLQGIFSHIARWRSLSLFLDDYQQRRIIEHLCTVPAPYLDELHLSLLTGDATLCFFTGNLNTSIYSYPLPFKTITSLRTQHSAKLWPSLWCSSYDNLDSWSSSSASCTNPSEHQTNRIVPYPPYLTSWTLLSQFRGHLWPPQTACDAKSPTTSASWTVCIRSYNVAGRTWGSARAVTRRYDLSSFGHSGGYPPMSWSAWSVFPTWPYECHHEDLWRKKGKRIYYWCFCAHAHFAMKQRGRTWTRTHSNSKDSSKDALEFIPAICSIIACRTSIHHIRLHFFIDQLPHVIWWEPQYCLVTCARWSGNILNVCSTCDAAWDRTNDTWVHICD